LTALLLSSCAAKVSKIQAHEKIDGIVERAYQQKPFESDEERLSVLLNLYKEMTEKEAK